MDHQVGHLDRRALWTVLLLALGVYVWPATLHGQTVGVGFQPISVPQGFSLIANPFAAGLNRVSDLISNPPDGFSVIKFDGRNWQTNLFRAADQTWSLPSMSLTPGEGALVSSPSPFSWISVGKPVIGELENFIPKGRSMRSSILPDGGLLSTDLNFPSVEGLTVSRVDLSGNFATIATYQNGSWNPSEPSLEIGASIYLESPEAVVWSRNFTVPEVKNPITISQQPQDLTVQEGEAINLTVMASGSDTLRFQWQVDGNDIIGADASSLSLPDARPESSGLYQVVVSDGINFLRSQRVQVIVNPKPEPVPQPPGTIGPILLSGVSDDGRFIEIQILGQIGEVYTVQATEDFQKWFDRGRDLENETGLVIFRERIASGKSRFYRAIVQGQ